MKATMPEALAVTALANRIFSELASVVGYGLTNIGEGYGVKINLRGPPPTDVTLPEEVNGVPARVQVVGRILSLGHPLVPEPPTSPPEKG